MSGYTPTTEIVRARYVQFPPEPPEWLRATRDHVDGAAFDRWLLQHDREVARNAIYAAADELLNGHQADKPHENHRVTVPKWLLEYARSHYAATSMPQYTPEEAK